MATEASTSARKPDPSNNDSVASSKSADWALEQCEHCDFRTRWKGNLRKHIEHHLYMNQMVDSSKERVQACHQLEQRLLKIKLLKKRDHANQKKSSLFMLLKKQFDGDEDNPISPNKKNAPLLAIVPA